MSAILWGTPVAATLLEYSFAASITVSKTGADLLPLTTFEENYWFPSLVNGQTYLATGRIEYDPDSFFSCGPSTCSDNLVYLHVGEYEFSLKASLGMGFSNGDPALGGVDKFFFADTLPIVEAGYMPDTFWFGEDGTFSLYDPTGLALTGNGIPPNLDGFLFGDINLFGQGISLDGSGAARFTRTQLQGSVGQIRSVPEPGALVLLVVGLAGMMMLGKISRRQRRWLRH